MENQHRKISGYRELNQTEIDLMNEIKSLGTQIEEVLIKVKKHLDNARYAEATDEAHNKAMQRIDNATPARFLALSKTEFQTGLMYATRAVAQPEFF
jgi:hypothetical protein